MYFAAFHSSGLFWSMYQPRSARTFRMPASTQRAKMASGSSSRVMCEQTPNGEALSARADSARLKVKKVQIVFMSYSLVYLV